MGITKRWTLPFTWVDNTDVSRLNSLKLYLHEVHNTLVENGAWIHLIFEPGQLEDFDSINLPNLSSTPFGFRIYEFNDGHSDITPIFMKVEYFRTYTNSNFISGPGALVLRHSFSDNKSFVPARTFVTNTATPGVTYSPGSFVTSYGEGFKCFNEQLGFFGVTITKAYRSGQSYRADSLCTFMLQRNLDENMNIIPGFSAFGSPVTTSNGSNENNIRWQMRFIGPDFAHDTNKNNFSYRQFDNSQTALSDGQLQVAPVYTQTPEIKQVPTLMTYYCPQIAAGTQFEVETEFGTFNYIALGHESGLTQNFNTLDVMRIIPVNNSEANYASVAMIWQ